MTVAAIGIDLGGSHLRAALLDQHGAVVHGMRHTLSGRTPTEVIAQVDGILRTLLKSVPLDDQNALPPHSHLPTGMGIAALLDPASGHITLAPNLGWHDVPFGALLQAQLGYPIRLMNDMHGITMGEVRHGAAINATHVLCVFVGTGVGLGVISAGRLLEGAHGMATEIGHMKITPHARVASTAGDGMMTNTVEETGFADPVARRLCGCGARGCLEAYTSGRHLPELVAAYAHAGMQTQLLRQAHGALAQITASQIEAAAQVHDAVAVRVWQDVADRLGMAIANTITLFDPEVVVLGGGVLTAAPSLRQQVQQQIIAYLSPAHRQRVRIAASQLGDDAGLIGSGWIALEERAAATQFNDK